MDIGDDYCGQEIIDHPKNKERLQKNKLHCRVHGVYTCYAPPKDAFQNDNCERLGLICERVPGKIIKGRKPTSHIRCPGIPVCE